METIQGIPLNYYFILSTVLFCIGALGVMMRRNAIIMFMCIEIMLNSVNVLMVALSRFFGDGNGQVFVFFIMVVAAAEVAVGLAIIIMIFRNAKTSDTDVLNQLKW